MKLLTFATFQLTFIILLGDILYFQIVTIRLSYKLQWPEMRMIVNESADWGAENEINISPDNIEVKWAITQNVHSQIYHAAIKVSHVGMEKGILGTLEKKFVYLSFNTKGGFLWLKPIKGFKDRLVGNNFLPSITTYWKAIAF